MSTAARTRSDGAGRVLPVAVALLVSGAILDVALGSGILVVPLFVLAPLVVAVRGASPGETALVAGTASVLAVVAGIADANTGSTGWMVAVASVVGGGLAAVGAATARARLKRDAERLDLLVALGDAVPAATVQGTAARLAELLVPAAADACVIDIPARDERPALLAVRVVDGLGPGAEDAVRTAPPPLGPATEVDERPRLVDDVGREGLVLRSCLTAPLHAAGRVVGTLRLAVTADRRYGPRDLRFAEVVADRIALALENAGLSAELLDVEARFEAIVDRMPDAVSVRERDGRLVYANAASVDIMRVSEDRLRELGVDEAMALFEVYDEDGRRLRYDQLPSARAWNSPADPDPMLVRNVVRATGEERWLLTKATAIRDDDGRPRFVISVIEDLTSVKRAELAQRVLAEAGRVLVSSLDTDRTLQQLAMLAVPELADWCGVDVPGRSGMIDQVAVGHADPEKVALARDMRRRYPMRLDAADGHAAVLRGEIPHMLIDEFTDAQLVAGADDDEHLALMRRVGLSSLMVVPMVGRSRILGALTFGSSRPHRFDAGHVALAEELGRRAGIAVENAQLYAERADIAHTLEIALVPDPVPLVPGWDVAAMYRPAGETTEAGGDFYDLVRTDDGWLLVMGDVTGKGARAASVTALARYTLRTAAMLTGDPAVALSALNLGLLRHGELSLCTAAMIALSEDEDGRARVRALSAGHPLPVLIRDGSATRLGRPGPLLGALEAASWPVAEHVLEPGDRIVLYTDGVTDAQGERDRFGDRRLLELLSSGNGTPPAGLVRRVEQELASFEMGPQRDDTALLAVGRLRPGEIALPGGPESVSLARATIRSRLEGTLPPERLGDVLVMTSELVTNAIRHGRAIGREDRIRVRLCRREDRLRVEVRDDGPGFVAAPAPGGPAPKAVGGLGLQLVDRMAGAWEAEREGTTTLVWFEVDSDAPVASIH